MTTRRTFLRFLSALAAAAVPFGFAHGRLSRFAPWGGRGGAYE